MKKYSLLVLVLLLVTGCHRAQVTEGPLQINTPPGWTVKFQVNQGKNFYNVAGTDTKYGLIFFQVPHMPAEAIPKVIDKYAKEYAGHNDADPDKYQLASDTADIGDITGPIFKGNFADFTKKDGNHYIFFLISNGADSNWEGEYVGPPDDWTTALKIVEGMKSKG